MASVAVNGFVIEAMLKRVSGRQPTNDRLEVARNRRADGERRDVPGNRGSLANGLKPRLHSELPLPYWRPGLGRARPSFAACGGHG